MSYVLKKIFDGGFFVSGIHQGGINMEESQSGLLASVGTCVLPGHSA